MVEVFDCGAFRVYASMDTVRADRKALAREFGTFQVDWKKNIDEDGIDQGWEVTTDWGHSLYAREFEVQGE